VGKPFVGRAGYRPDGSRILSEEVKRMNAQSPDYADISHADIVTRDLKRRKPFQQNGKGYRDTLLWETIVRHYITTSLQMPSPYS